MTCEICGLPLVEDGQTYDFAGRKLSLCARDAAKLLAVLVADSSVDEQRELYRIYNRWIGTVDPDKGVPSTL